MGKWNSYGVFSIYSQKVLRTTASPAPRGWVHVDLVQRLLWRGFSQLTGSERNGSCWFSSLPTDIQFQGWTCVGICSKIRMLNHSEDTKGKVSRAARTFNNARAFQIIGSILIDWNWWLAANSLTRNNMILCWITDEKNVKPNIASVVNVLKGNVLICTRVHLYLLIKSLNLLSQY